MAFSFNKLQKGIVPLTSAEEAGVRDALQRKYGTRKVVELGKRVFQVRHCSVPMASARVYDLGIDGSSGPLQESNFLVCVVCHHLMPDAPPSIRVWNNRRRRIEVL